MWLFGLFLAEGSTYIDSQYAKTSWSIHSDEVSEVVQYLDRLNLNYNIYYRKTDRSATICVNSRPITEWLSSQIVGSGNARTKQMPSWVLVLDEGLRRSCFNGMVFGDGYVRSNGRIEYSTSSRALAFGIKLLGQSLGLASSVSRQEPPDFVAINGRQIFPGDSYTVSFDRSNTVKFEDGKSWVGISNIEPEGDVRVYDLEVEEDHSYIAEGIVVHNSVGKSLSIKFRAFAFPFVCPGEEMVITAPEGIHLDAVTDNIESLYTNNRLAREMIAKGRGGIKHRPFMINFINGGRIIGRIPQRDGKGLKGTHPIWLEQDEASDFPEQAWAEIIETVKIQNPMARWRAHGVTRGVGGGFDERCQPDSGWKVHALPAMFRPNWTTEERQQKIQEYGGHVDSVDYRRNILGLPGDQNSPIFVLYRLMAATDVDTGSNYNEYEYVSLEIDEAAVREYGSIIPLLDLPANHRSYKRFWIGMDLGWTIAPTSIVIFAEDSKTRKGKNSLKLLARILLKKITATDQAAAILHLLDIYRPVAFALDSTGAGLPLFDYVQKATREDPNLRSLTSRIKGYNFSEKIIAEFDDSIQIDEMSPDGYKEAAIYRNVLEWSTDILRNMVDEQTIILPYDKSIISEFQGQTWSYSKAAMDSYGRKRIFSTGSFHTLDACRMAALAFQQQTINDFIDGHQQEWQPPPMLFL